jgi:hypothetical protein
MVTQLVMRAAQPALGNVRHTAARGFIPDRFLRLALGAYKEDIAAVGNGVAYHIVCRCKGLCSLLEIDNMDAVPLGEDIRLHRGIPFVGAVTKMNAAFQQGFHGNNSSHWLLNSFAFKPPLPSSRSFHSDFRARPDQSRSVCDIGRERRQVYHRRAGNTSNWNNSRHLPTAFRI